MFRRIAAVIIVLFTILVTLMALGPVFEQLMPIVINRPGMAERGWVGIAQLAAMSGTLFMAIIIGVGILIWFLLTTVFKEATLGRGGRRF